MTLSKKILIIDDNISISKMLSKVLELEGHDCMISNEGRNALTLLENQKFDATILDIAMPGFSGLDIIDTLEKNDNLKDHKIIVLTASVISEDKMQELKKRGIHGVLLKPVDPDVLTSVICQ